MKGYKLDRVALAVALIFSSGPALSAPDNLTVKREPAVLYSEPETATGKETLTLNTWWENYQFSDGFKEAIAQFGLTVEQMNANAGEMETRAKDPNDPLFWLKRTLDIYPAHAPDYYNIPITESNAVMRERTTHWDRNNYFLTREYGKAGEAITIKAGTIPAGVTCYAAMDGDRDAFKSTGSERTLTSESTTTYVLPQDGILLLGCKDTNKHLENLDTAVPMQIISGGSQRHPLFIFGINSRHDWAEFSQTIMPDGYGVFFDGRTRYAASQKKILASADTDIMQAMRENLLRTITYDKLNGLDGSSDLHQPSRSLFMASFNACCWAKSIAGQLAIGFADNVPSTYTWGTWHEYGHQYQMKWSWSGLGEVTVNLYSLAACYKKLGDVDVKQCSTNPGLTGFTWDQQAVGNVLKSGQRWDLDTEPNVFRRTTMFGQLMTTWPELYPALGKAFREAYNRGANKAALDENQEKIDWFVTHASRLSGHDLREFFTLWGVDYSAAAGEQIAAMNLPQPAQPVATYEATLTHTGSTPTTVSLEIINKNLTHGIGFIANTAKIGPRNLVWYQNGDTTLHTQVVDAQNRPFTVALRGKKLTGGCAYHSVNSAVTCASGADIHFSVTYYPEDNPHLPAGEYHGTLPLIASDWHDPVWSANVNIPLTISK